VDVQTDGGFAPNKPRLLFERSGYMQGTPIRGWDISLDDQQFLMAKIENKDLPPVTELILVHNWFEELKHLAPVEKN
jgi:hypothetical protein